MSDQREANCEGERKSGTQCKRAAGLWNESAHSFSFRSEDVNMTLEVEK